MVKTGTWPRAAHEVPLLTTTASCVIDMEDTAVATGSSGTPHTLKKSPLDFANEDPPQIITERGRTKDQAQDGLSHELPPVENATTMEVVLEPEYPRKKSLSPMGLDAGATFSTPATQDAPNATKSMGDPDPLFYAKPQPHLELDIAQSSKKTATVIPTKNVATTKVQGLFSTESLESGKSTSFPSVDGSPGGIYQPGWGVTNNCCLDTPDACQDMVDHIVLLGAVEAKMHGLHNQTKNLETLLEAEVDMKKVAEAKNVELAKELESLHVQFLDLQVSNNQLSQKVSNLQAQVTGEEKIKSASEEFKKYEDDRVEYRCAEMDARLDKLSVYFNEELYPHMLTAIVGRRWVIGHGLRLAVMKCLKHGIEHGKADQDLAAVEAYDPEADRKYIKALQDLKDLKYPLVDQLERLKDAPMKLIMASLHLESDSEEDAS
nr:hypothetical protein [Tanacetum cinerariifolium]